MYENYKDMIEKQASAATASALATNAIKGNKFKNLANSIMKSKKARIALGVGALGAGAYAISPDKQKKQMRDVGSVIGKSVLDGQVNGQLQDTMKWIGGGLGTAYAVKKGKSLNQAAATGGLAGMALGDITGSVIIPTHQLYRKHKKEYGTAPDAKSVAAVMGANVLPTAALWGTLYGAKKGIAARKNISANLSGGMKETSDAFKKMKEVARNPDFNMSDIMSEKSKAISGIKKVTKSMLPIGIAAELVAAPTYFATPENVIKMKKKKEEKREK